MPKSISFSEDGRGSEQNGGDTPSDRMTTTLPSPELPRQVTQSVPDLRTRPRLPPSFTTGAMPTETTGLLSGEQRSSQRYNRSGPTTPRSQPVSRISSSIGSLRSSHRHRSRRTSDFQGLQSGQLTPAWKRATGLKTPKLVSQLSNSWYPEADRLWYDQFTSTDWVHDSIQDGHRLLELRKRPGFRGKLALLANSAQGWILMVLIGICTACVAYFVDVTDAAIFDIKSGYCRKAWYAGRVRCCNREGNCDDWQNWSQLIHPFGVQSFWVDYIAFILGGVVLASLACFLTLWSKTVVPSHIASTFDENLGAVKFNLPHDDKDPDPLTQAQVPTNIYYSAAGSGVAEVKVILSGFVLHGYLGFRTLITKTVALVLSVSSGMSLGKEGPYVHIATCIGNVACRFVSKYRLNDGKRREVLSASAASGVVVAFGSPLGGVLFGLEEVSYYFPPKTLFQTFFCCIVAALMLKFLNPYGTSKIVLFEVRYTTDWRAFELIIFAFLGMAGGLIGALFIKASRFWASTFRRLKIIKNYPLVEVVLVSLITGVLGFWNRYTKLPVAELLFELAAPCDGLHDSHLCPNPDRLPHVIWYLFIALLIKTFLTIVTFGIKVPAGIYVPSMVIGGLMGRIVGHITQLLTIRFPDFFIWSSCPRNGGIEACVTPGVYALAAAGAVMCGVTRLSVTLAVILFELTGSLDHVLPFSLAVLFAKFTADAIEPLSIYDLLTDMNSYPFVDNKTNPVFDSELGDITPHPRLDRLIDISISPLVKASELRAKLNRLQNLGELDGGLPIIRNHILVGLIPAPDLEYALDHLVQNEDTAFCRMFPSHHTHDMFHQLGDSDEEQDDDVLEFMGEPYDFMPYVDQAPMSLDVRSPMDLVYQCFVKLGLRYICVLDDGEYRGLVHKKAFVRYVKTMEHKDGHHM